jgi:membrane protein implicated in regulation of membrane protease activity
MRNALVAILLFLAAVAILLGVLHYFKILALIALVIGFGVLVGIVLLGVITGILLILAVPYYLVAKKPKIEEHGTYTLEDVKGKEDEVKKRE